MDVTTPSTDLAGIRGTSQRVLFVLQGSMHVLSSPADLYSFWSTECVTDSPLVSMQEVNKGLDSASSICSPCDSREARATLDPSHPLLSCLVDGFQAAGDRMGHVSSLLSASSALSGALEGEVRWRPRLHTGLS